MSSEKTYLFFLPNFNVGGAGNSILRICKELKKKDNDIIILSLGANYYRSYFKKIDIKVIELPYKRLLRSIPNLKKIISNYLDIRKKVIFISNINYANAISCLFFKEFLKLKKFKLVLFERTPIQELDQFINVFSYLKNRIIKLIIKFFYKKADFIIGNSTNVSKDLKKYCKCKVLTFNPIVENNKNVKKKNKIFKFIWIGRNSYEKNLEDLIQSINFFKNEKFKLTIISDSFSKNQKETLSEVSNQKIDLVYFNKKNIRQYFKDSDVLISTSIYEGFPNVVAEAVSYNCTIITSNSFGGIRDLIKNENFGYYYKLYDSRELFLKMKKSMERSKNNLIKKKNARENLNYIHSKNKQLINFLRKL